MPKHTITSHTRQVCEFVFKHSSLSATQLDARVQTKYVKGLDWIEERLVYGELRYKLAIINQDSQQVA
jgi:hypothetical protein